MGETETGTLADRPLGSLLRDLADRQFTGLLHIDGSAKRVICLDGGRVYLALSSPGPSLQRVIVDAGAVDEAGWRSAMQRADEYGSVAAALLAEGAPRAVLEDALCELTLATLLELLVPDRDDFRINAGERHKLGAEITFAVSDLLDEAGGRLERWSALEGSLPSMSTLLRRAPTLPAGRLAIELNRVQWQIIDSLDEPMSLASLIESIGLGAFKLFDGLYHLMDDGVVLTESDAPTSR